MRAERRSHGADIVDASPLLWQEHREKLQTRKPLWAAMITQSLGRRDPRAHTPAARRAVLGELAALREEGTWDEYDMMELGDAKAKHLDAHFSRVFAIVGIKDFELEEQEWTYKGRIVLGGDDIKDGRGDWAIFEEAGSVPTSMSAARCLQGCSARQH